MVHLREYDSLETGPAIGVSQDNGQASGIADELEEPAFLGRFEVARGQGQKHEDRERPVASASGDLALERPADQGVSMGP